MASTKTERSDEQVGGAGYTKRFATPSSNGSQPRWGAADEASQPAGALMSRRAAIGGVGMGAAAVLCFVLAAGFSGGPATVSEATAQQIFSLREQIQLAQAKAEALPEPQDADRELVMAQTYAGEIAELQNEYRHLTPQVAAAGGELDADATAVTRRHLVSYFAPSVDQSMLRPWYLLASDKNVPAGIGIPMSFDSGFKWVAQRPYMIEEDSTVRVTWLAMQTDLPEGRTPAVLAWARADYDLTSRTFSSVQTGTTVTGQALRQEVKPS